MWRRKLLALAFALLLLFSAVAPAYAADDDNWTQVLSYSSVNNSGSNYFVVNKSAIITLDLPQRTYGVWIDMLVSTSDMDIKSVYSIWQGSSTALTVKKVDEGLHRVYGRLSYHTYTQLQLGFNCAGTGYYELLSCRICSLTADGTTANATVELVTSQYNLTGGLTQILMVPGNINNRITDDSYQAVISVKDATKYDKLTVYGSVNYASINSIRATYGGLALEYTVNFIDVEAEGHFYGDGYDVTMFGKYIYAINIDLSQINRSQEQYCLVYISGDFDQLCGMEFNCQTATGYVNIADTADATWWNRFTTFMTDLFSPDDSASEDYQDEAGQQRDELDDMNEQLDNVTKPAVDGIQMDVNDYIDGGDSQALAGALAALTGNNLLISMMCITLTIALVGYVLYGKR